MKSLITPDGSVRSLDTVWITGGHVVDVRNGTIRRDVNVQIHHGRIAKITDGPVPADSTTIELGGRFLLPGLISAHTHLSVVYPFSDTDESESAGITALRSLSRAQDALTAGVTTIRCVHEQNRADILVRAAAQQGWVAAPRILAAGRAITTTGGHGYDSACVVADGYESFLRAARAELAAGADHIKIFITGGIAKLNESFSGAEMTLEEMQGVVRAADEKDSYVVAHAGSGGAIRQALEAGVRCFEHAYDVEDDVIAEMSRRQVFLTPTLCVTRCPEWMAEHDFTDWQIERAIATGPGHLASIRRAVAGGLARTEDGGRGITFLAGTDYPPGEPIEDTIVAVREMEFLTDAGLSPPQALRAGTLDAALLFGMSNELGAVEEGYIADLIVTDADPTSDVSALRRISFVMQAGRIIRDDIPTTAVVSTVLTGAGI